MSPQPTELSYQRLKGRGPWVTLRGCEFTGYNVCRAICLFPTPGLNRLARKLAQRGQELAQGCTVGKPQCRDLKWGITICPRRCSPGAHLFFSSELKSRVPASSWLSLWRGTPSKAAVEPTGPGLAGGCGSGERYCRGRGTGWRGLPGSVYWAGRARRGVPDPPTTSSQAPVGVRTSSSPAQGSLLSPIPTSFIPFPAFPPMSLPALIPIGLRPQRWPPPGPKEREPLTCGGMPIGGPSLQDQRPLGAEREVRQGRGFRGAIPEAWPWDV